MNAPLHPLSRTTLGLALAALAGCHSSSDDDVVVLPPDRRL